MTQSIQKQKIEPSWSVSEIQEHVVKSICSQMQMKLEMAESGKLQNAEELRNKSAQHKAECFKKDGVKSPLELVKKLAELEVNLTGSKVSISGDDERATLIQDEPKVYLEIRQKIDEQKLEKLREFFSAWMTQLGQNFGFQTKVELAPEGKGTKITFSR
ncbi:MAG TPA: hypothetical protein V6C81_15470 [Planktothrix sp.]